MGPWRRCLALIASGDARNRPSVSPAPPGSAERSNFPLRRRLTIRPAPMESLRPARPVVCGVAEQNARSDHGWPCERRGPTASLQGWLFRKPPEAAGAIAGFANVKLLLWPVDARQFRQRRLDSGGNLELADSGRSTREQTTEATGPTLVEAARPLTNLATLSDRSSGRDASAGSRRVGTTARLSGAAAVSCSGVPSARARALVVGKEASAARDQRHSAARPNPRRRLARRRRPQTDRVRRTKGARPAPPLRATSPAAAPASAPRTARTAHTRVTVPAWRVSVEPRACLSLFHRSTIGSARGALVRHRRLAAAPDSDDDRHPPRSLSRSTPHRQ